MSPCEQIRAQAAGLAALPPADPERKAAEEHARGCPGCAAALADAERFARLLGEVGGGGGAPAPGAPPAAILEDLKREGRARAAAGGLAAAGVIAAVLLLARARSGLATHWAFCAGLAAASLALAAAAARWTLAAAGVAVALALLSAAALGGPGALVPLVGLDCLLTELAGAAAALGALWLAVRRGATVPARPAVAAAAAAGALASDAALQVACRATASLAHGLSFHVVGVVVAAALGFALRLKPRGDAAAAP